MIETLKNLFSSAPSVNYSELVKQGAMIVDVRTRGEFNGGHVKGSINIPLDQLTSNLARFKDKNQAIITCCASGMRSGSAKSLLKSNGFTNVHNAGSWLSLNSKL